MTSDPAGELARTPPPPYTAVIFSSVRTPGDNGYSAMATAMEALAVEQPGYLGIEAARDGIGITVSYWRDDASARRWKQVAAHLLAQTPRARSLVPRLPGAGRHRRARLRTGNVRTARRALAPDSTGPVAVIDRWPLAAGGCSSVPRSGRPSEWVEAGREQAEPVALGVGEHVPPLVPGLADVGPARTEVHKTFELGALIAVGGVDVDVQPGLPLLRRIPALSTIVGCGPPNPSDGPTSTEPSSL